LLAQAVESLKRPNGEPFVVKPLVSPSVLSANFAKLQEDIMAAERGGGDRFHLDVMDGHFVPNISYGPMIVRTMKKITNVPLDAHLMISDPDKYIPEFVEAGAEFVIPHIEASYDVYRSVQLVVELGAKAGIALNPGTPVEWVEPLIDKIDMVLIMSVCPGFGGQKFQPHSLKRIKALRSLLDKVKPSVHIAVDGGVKKENIAEICASGADILVAGSAIFEAQDIEKAVKDLKRLVEKL
jgi:ribulose-phosphate 3-epimerase